MKLNLPFKSLSLITLASLLFIIGLFLSYQYKKHYNHLLNTAKNNAILETQKASKKMDDFIGILKTIALKTARQLSQKPHTKKEIETIITQNSTPVIFGIGAVFVPYAVDSQTELYAPYLLEIKGKNVLKHIEEEHDYTQLHWFKQYLNSKNGGFLEPYATPISQTILAEYVAPITNQEGKSIGIVIVNQSIEHLEHILNTLFLDKNGYWSILTSKGTFLAHPQSQIAKNETSIYDIAKKINDPGLNSIAKNIVAGASEFYEYNNEVTGNPSWLLSEPIAGTNWSIIGVFDKKEIEIDHLILRRMLIKPILFFALCGLLTILFLLSLCTSITQEKWWVASIVSALILLSCVIWIWYAIYLYPAKIKSLENVESKTQLHEYLKSNPDLSTTKAKDATELDSNDNKTTFDILINGYQNKQFIPTGIYINSLQFTSAQKIQISAFIWQRYTKGLHDNLPQGFILPQATETTIHEISRTMQGDTEVIMWSIQASLDQQLIFQRYPFDIKQFHILIWHQYTKKDIVLVPDLDGYQLLNPSSLPGIDIDVNLPGWTLLKSNFAYQKTSYANNFGSYSIGSFGIYESLDKSFIPELNFSITTQRKLLNTLISDLLPLSIIAVLIFAILLSSYANQLSATGWSASVFFSTIFAQLRLRENIPSSQVVYMETFYFLMYLMIILLLFIIISAYLKTVPRWIAYKKHLIPQLLYWPVLSGSSLILAMWYLY